LMIQIYYKFRWSRWLTVSLSFLVALPSLAKVVLSNQLFVKKDVRTEAQEWVEAEVPSGKKMAMDVPFFMPRLRPTIKQLEEKKASLLAKEDGAKAKRIDLLLEAARQNPNSNRYELYFMKEENSEGGFLFTQPSVPYRMEELKTQGIEYVMVTRIHPNQGLAFYEDLRRQAQLVARFTPYKNPSRSSAIDPQPLTGGPFLWKELTARERNGQIIEIYQLA